MQVEKIVALKTAGGGASKKAPKAGNFLEALESCEVRQSSKRDDNDGADNANIVQLMAAYGLAASNPQQPMKTDASGAYSGDIANKTAAGAVEDAAFAAGKPRDAALLGLLQYPSVTVMDAPFQQSVDAGGGTALPQADAESAQAQGGIAGGLDSLIARQGAAQGFGEIEMGNFSAQLRTFSNIKSAQNPETPAAERQNPQLEAENGVLATARAFDDAVSDIAVSNPQAQGASGTPAKQIDAASKESADAAPAAKAAGEDFSAKAGSAITQAARQAGQKAIDSETADLKELDAENAAEKAETPLRPEDSAAKAGKGQLRQPESGDKQASGDGSGFDMSRLVSTAAQPFEASDAENLRETVKAEVMNQVSDAVKKAAENGRTEMRIRLNPEELGGISIRIISQNGQLSIQITADNQKTGQLLASSMHELAESLQNQGITMDKAEVTYANSSGFDAAASQQQNQNRQNADYSLPKWTVAMETRGTVTVPDVLQPEPAETEKVSETSILSILA